MLLPLVLVCGHNGERTAFESGFSVDEAEVAAVIFKVESLRLLGYVEIVRSCFLLACTWEKGIIRYSVA